MQKPLSNTAAIKLYPDINIDDYQGCIKQYFIEQWSIEICTADFDKFWCSEIDKAIEVGGGFSIAIKPQAKVEAEGERTTLEYYLEVGNSDGDFAFEFLSDFPGDLLGDYGIEEPAFESNAPSN